MPADEVELLLACRYGHSTEAKRLLSQLANANKVRDTWWWNERTLLHYSCRHGWLDVTKRLVEDHDCDVVISDNEGETPLHEACREGHLDIVAYLVNRKGFVSVACFNKDGNTPLDLACENGHHNVVDFLMEWDVNTAWQCRNKSALLHHSSHLHVIKKLVEHYKCDPESVDEQGCTVLHRACCKGHLNIVSYLVGECHCNVSCQSPRGDTPLHLACRNNNLDMATILFTGRDCDKACQHQNMEGETLLHYSCHNGWFNVTRMLVEKYFCHPDSCDSDGETPLHKACCEGHIDIAEYLVSDCGCSTTCQNYIANNTPLHLACIEKNLTIVELLFTGKDSGVTSICQNSSKKAPIHYCCCNGWLDITRRLVEEFDCDPDVRDSRGMTPLHEACLGGHVDIVRYLVNECGCSISWQDSLGNTPLHLAASVRTHLPITEILIMGLDCSGVGKCKNKDGKTPLHFSCCHGWLHITRTLVEQYGCDPDITDSWNNTPLHEACRMDRTDIVQFLLSTGRVDPWCRNSSNQTPLQLSKDYIIAKLFSNFKTHLESTMKVFVLGNPAAGKSTMVKVIENKVTRRFGTFASHFRKMRNIAGVQLQTAGISTVTFHCRRFGTVTFYDLAGQFEYYSSHDALVANLMSTPASAAIFMVVVKLNESETEIIRTLRYWITFIENCCSRVKAKAHVVVVGSWADKVKVACGQKWTNVKKAFISSIPSLSFVGSASFDCRKIASNGLERICDIIESSCTTLRGEENVEQKELIHPHLLHTFITTKCRTNVACSVGELCAKIAAENDALLPTASNLLSPLLSKLSDGGHLLYLPNKLTVDEGWVIINKQAILSEINGTVFAPENFKQHYDIATSTGVVPKSKIANVFDAYNIEMILGVLTRFEFCQKIEDPSTFVLVSSSDTCNDGTSSPTQEPDYAENYYFFPALVQVERPTDMWQSSSLGQYRCGWCLQCANEWQYLSPRFLHVLVLRLAFSFTLAANISGQKDKTSLVLRRRCAVWKNGIQWLNVSGVETLVEVVEQNRSLFLLMCCPEKQAMECVKFRSSLIHTILSCIKEFCPNVDCTEFLIDPSHLLQQPVDCSSMLTMFSMTDIITAVENNTPYALDYKCGKKSLDLERALHFEPYLGLDRKILDRLHCKYCAWDKVSDSFLQDLSVNFYHKMDDRVQPSQGTLPGVEKLLKLFGINPSVLYYRFDLAHDERDNPVARCFRLLLAWKDSDSNGGTYKSLRTTLDTYSIFCGRNPLVSLYVLSVVI